jgi:predicted SnoaL-like aldol condensation-catalyzing enzyme
MNFKLFAVKTLTSALCALLFIPNLQAKQNQQSELEQANLKKALYCMEILENRPDMVAKERLNILRDDCFSENYIQHSPHMEDGREAVLAVFAKRYEKYPKLSMSVKRTASEGDLVWMHLHVKRTPDSLGASVIHIFRMEDGKLAEHWGVGQPVPKTAKNTNTMF